MVSPLTDIHPPPRQGFHLHRAQEEPVRLFNPRSVSTLSVGFVVFVVVVLVVVVVLLVVVVLMVVVGVVLVVVVLVGVGMVCRLYLIPLSCRMQQQRCPIQ